MPPIAINYTKIGIPILVLQAHPQSEPHQLVIPNILISLKGIWCSLTNAYTLSLIGPNWKINYAHYFIVLSAKQQHASKKMGCRLCSKQ